MCHPLHSFNIYVKSKSPNYSDRYGFFTVGVWIFMYLSIWNNLTTTDPAIRLLNIQNSGSAATLVRPVTANESTYRLKLILIETKYFNHDTLLILTVYKLRIDSSTKFIIIYLTFNLRWMPLSCVMCTHRHNHHLQNQYSMRRTPCYSNTLERSYVFMFVKVVLTLRLRSTYNN